MLASRIIAAKAFDINCMSLNSGSLKLYGNDEDNWLHISQVIHFFERYAICYDLEYLDSKLANATLKRYFENWYKKYLNTTFEDHRQKGETDEWYSLVTSIDKAVKKFGIKLETVEGSTITSAETVGGSL